MLMTYRPRICPYHRLVEHVPKGSSILDIGCGNGLWLLLLAELGWIYRGIGLDVSAEKIRIADALKQPDWPLSFRHILIDEAWPEKVADYATMIDVIHHIPPADQKKFVQSLRRVGASSVIIKDIDPNPFWKRSANTLHDLVVAGQRPRYVHPSVLCEWLREIGYENQYHHRCDMLWYSHFIIVARKTMFS
jgi:2-polyprenyl-3-methyl-5-hydroxy-6-metoxy-1,4-benzoquinol methylase